MNVLQIKKVRFADLTGYERYIISQYLPVSTFDDYVRYEERYGGDLNNMYGSPDSDVLLVDLTFRGEPFKMLSYSFEETCPKEISYSMTMYYTLVLNYDAKTFDDIQYRFVNDRQYIKGQYENFYEEYRKYFIEDAPDNYETYDDYMNYYGFPYNDLLVKGIISV